ncbi:hypothetical protein MKQ70_16485 [Chitinophaga sedimenti]|uniref:hypothetical protein n=1 Tax=Chitinophaga sedimenti TaxID=2033606 RepID=UPI002006A747|nr:hypothetical protein [Chitinophaga sedimenti]MCK7556526.1 hypothetical protein [Chitinophaga sedimenti]
MERLQELFRLYYNKTATEEQKMEFMFLVQHSPPEELSQLIAEHGEQLQDTDEVLEPQRAEKLLANILAKETPAVRRIPIRTWWAAAVVLLAMGIGGYFLFFRAPARHSLASLPQEQRFKNDIAPAQQQVLLTLPDGTITSLDSVQNGTLRLSGTQAVKQEGSLSYQPTVDGHRRSTPSPRKRAGSFTCIWPMARKFGWTRFPPSASRALFRKATGSWK